MAIRADRVGVRQDQVDIHGRVTSPSFLNELLDDLPEWTDMPVWVNGTEELLPSNNSVPVTSPILADIAYPDIRRDNQYFTYRESPTPVDGLAKIKSIKGNTLVWNKLVENGNFASTSGWLSFGVTLSVANNKATVSIASDLSNNASIARENIFNGKDGHTFFMSADFTPPRETKVGFYVGNNRYEQIISANTKTRVSLIGASSSTITNANLYVYINRDSNLQEGDSVIIENVNIFDLTTMFGAGNEPTIEEFKSLFPLPYYDYNAGTLLSFNGTGLKTGGKNLIDFSTLEIGKNWFKASSVDRAIIEFAVEENKEYTISLDYSSNISNAILVFRTGWNAGQISNTGMDDEKTCTFTTPSACKVVCVQFNARVNGFVLSQSDFYGFWNCALTDTFNTTTLPISTYFPTGMKSAGTVYDELTPTKGITRIGVVDLGSLSWGYSATSQRFYSVNFVNDVKNNSADTLANALCARYENGIWNEIQGDTSKDMMFSISESNVLVRDKRYTTASEFKTSVNGVYLFYELATPVELPTMSFE